jgi:hypothetical protein
MLSDPRTWTTLAYLLLMLPLGGIVALVFGVLIFTALMHAARGIGRVQVALARTLLVKP